MKMMKKNTGKKGLALCLSLVMCFSLLQLTAFAEGEGQGDEEVATEDMIAEEPAAEEETTIDDAEPADELTETSCAQAVTYAQTSGGGGSTSVPVYVYVQIEGLTPEQAEEKGWTPNNNANDSYAWYTIGKVTTTTNVLSAAEYEKQEPDTGAFDTVKSLVSNTNTTSFTIYNGTNASKNLNSLGDFSITWDELKVSSGANDYSEANNKLVWHLNGTLTYHTVTYMSNDGETTLKTEAYLNGDTVTVANYDSSWQAKEGCSFVGWATEANTESADDSYDADGTFTITENTTLYAVWKEDEPNTCTVTFYPNYDNREPTTEIVVSGDKVSAPDDPIRDGYTFDGWYTDKENGEKYSFDTEVTSDTTLYAHWIENKPNTCTVSFDLNYDNKEPTTEIVVSGETVEKPDDPIREGYTFDGWYTDKENGNVYNFEAAVTENTTLYAHWTEKTYKVTIHYVSDLNPETSLKDDEEVVLAYKDYDKDEQVYEYDVSSEYYIPISLTVGDQMYVKDRVDGDVKGTTDKDVTITVVYSLDAKGGTEGGTDPNNTPDNIPDKYQTIVTYRIVGGTWDGNDNADKYEVVTFATKSDVDGTWTATTESVKLEKVPSGMQANAGYLQTTGSWDTRPTTLAYNAGDTAYTYSFTSVGSYAVTVNYLLDGDETETPLKGSQPRYFLETAGYDVRSLVEDAFTADSGDHYVRVGDNGLAWQSNSGSAAGTAITINLYYALDNWKDAAPDDPDDTDSLTGGDNIPDKYQVVIYYAAEEGGSVDPEIQVETLTDAEGNYAESGSVTLNSTATPEDGYTFDSWMCEEQEEFSGTDAALTSKIYVESGTYTFTAHFAADDDDDNAGGGGTTGGTTGGDGGTTTTTTPTTPTVDIGDTDTPLADTPDNGDADTPNDTNDTPAADDGGSTDAPDGATDGTPDEGLTDIPDEGTPLADIGEPDTPLADIPDGNVPLADIPDADAPLAEISDEDVPLNDVPQTSDNFAVWIVMMLLSGLGLAWLALTNRKRVK